MLLNIIIIIAPFMGFLLFAAVFYLFYQTFPVIFSGKRKDFIYLLPKIKITLAVIFSLILFERGISIYVIEQAISQVNDFDSKIMINDQELSYQDKIIFADELGDYKLSKNKPAGSSPGWLYKVIIVNVQTELVFEFKQDNRDKNYFWIYFPKYGGFEQVGFMNSRLLNKFQ
ncbi:MAG: hypothetical protein OEY19_13540 [Gammaproteobacteria bacterium]|nr:hypothetical protein [Gammaproteobacteria bacterium]MDH5629015.1 hypothetical protein [Gammaproteobacteria bacterium]